MDWLRRNWPDLLIGIALVAVIAGIIATLVTGGSFFPVGQNTRTSTPTTQNSTTQSVAPQTPSAPSTSTNSSGGSASEASGGSQQTGASGSTAGGSSTAGGQSGTTATAPSNGGVSVLPPSSGGSSGESAGSAPSSSTASSGTSSSGASASGATASSAGSQAGGGQAATASSGPGSAAPYRISVGAFSHKDYAQRQEQVFKQAGYPAFLASQGDLTIVLVGPYKSQSEAEQVASKIKSGDFGVDPVVYQFQGTSDQAPQPASSSSASGSPTASSGSSSASGSSATSSSASAPSGQRFLQVGAYGSADSAKPQRDRLESMGFQVQERNENGLVKLLIGPFGPDRLQQVQSQLKSAGIDSFPR